MREREIRAMIQALKDIQLDENLSSAGMARLLGFSPAHLSLVYAGKRRPGIRFVRAVLEQFPQIRDLIAKSLQDEGGAA